MTLLNLLYHLKSQKVLIWKNSNGNLSFSFDKKVGFSDSLKEDIKKHKVELLEILAFNHIDSENKAKEVLYYKLPDSYRSFDLRSIQKGIVLQNYLDQEKSTYNIPLFIRLKEVDTEILKKAVFHLLEKNPILRMSVYGDLKYKILPLEEFQIHEFDIESDHVEELCELKARHEFSLNHGKLINTELMRIRRKNEFILNLTHHHLLTDAFSSSLIISEVLTTYTRFVSGDLSQVSSGLAFTNSSAQLSDLSYFDYVEYQTYELQTENYKKAITQLTSDLDAAEKLDLRKKGSIRDDNQAGLIEFCLNASIYRELKQLSLECNTSLYSILITGLYRVLTVYSGGQAGFPIGLTVSNRPTELNHVVGPFINTLPLVPNYSETESFIENIKKINQKLIYLNQHQQVNLNLLTDGLKRSKEDIADLMHVLFTYHNFKQEIHYENRVNYETLLINDRGEKFGISVIAKEEDHQISFAVTYLQKAYDEAYIKGIFQSFVSLLGQLSKTTVKNPTYQIQCLNKKDYQQVVHLWNATDREFLENKTIYQMFEDQVEKTPENTAVLFKNTQLTYRELNQRANQMAHYLRDQCGIKPDSLVCVCLDRSENLLVAILGILKAGGAYVPIDPNYPDDRFRYILEDTNTSVILTEKRYQKRIEILSGKAIISPVISVDSQEFSSSILSQKSYSNPNFPITSTHLAYVIYTSGTTGKPKGVMIEHRGVINRIQWMNHMYPLKETDKILQKTPYVFDVSVWELFWAHWYGASLVFAEPDGHKDADYILKLIEKESITIAHFVPSMLSVFEDALEAVAQNTTASAPSLRYLFCSGEELKLTHVKRCHRLLPHTEIHNLYGPTEASVDVLYYDCNDRKIEAVYIGKPIDNTTVYVLDQNLSPLPVGAIGELYLGGVGLARGYLNKSELTLQKFIKNPFQTEKEQSVGKNGWLYKTGDLARWRPDGNIEFLGRNDFQVKIRGHRIELGEIETAIASFEGVKESVILVKEHVGAGSGKGAGESSSNSKYLVGYYVSDHKLDEEKILQFLHSRLPEYMVPSLLVHLEKLPLTTNGKLDRKALPDPEFKRANLYVAARNELESQLCQVWAEVLGVPESLVGIRDDFFRLGGDSIISIQLVSRLRQRLGLNISVKDIFSHKTIERLYDQVLKNSVQKSEVSQIKTEQGVLSGEVPLLPIQKWFFENRFERKNHWNQSFLIKASTLELEKLRQSIARLVEHHDGFRLRFAKKSDQYIQFYDSHARIEELKVLDIRTLGLKEGSPEFQEKLDQVLTEWQSHFDLERGPLYSVGYLHGYQDGSSRVYFALHHLLIDVVSWRVIAEDLRDLYHQKELGPKGSSYRQWVNAVENYGKTHSEEREYWQKVLADYEVQTSLGRLGDHSVLESARSTKSTESARDTGSARSNSHLEFNREQTQALLRESNRAYHTQVNDLLLTALGYALAEVTGKKTNHIVLEGHGREEIDPQMDVSRSVGWFTTMYPVRLEVGEDLGSSIKSIKENLRQIPEKGMGYGAVFGYGEKALPQICFNYLGQLDQEDSRQPLWNIANESSGMSFHPENHEYARINILGVVNSGRLKVSITTLLGQNTADILGEQFRRSLAQIIDHCDLKGIQKNEVEYTKSDFEEVNSEADLTGLPLVPSSNQYDWFEMTEIQKAYLMGRLSSYEIGNVSNHIYSEYYYKTLDASKLENVINRLIEKFEVLRTVYSLERLQQRFLRLEDISRYQIRVNDYSNLDLNDDQLKEIRNRLSHQVYNPEKFPLFTFEVSKFRDGSILHISIDLILLDVQSRLAMFSLMDKLYRGHQEEIHSPSITFKDYQDYYQLLKNSAWYKRDKSYWKNKIASMPLRPSLPFKTAPESIEYPIFSDHTLYVDSQTWAKFKEKAREYNISYSSILLGLYGSVISYFSGYKEFLITLTLFNRYSFHQDSNRIWGDFTSTNLFHFADFGSRLLETLKRTHHVLWDDIHHALYAGLEVQRDLAKLNRLNMHQSVSPIVFTGVVGNKASNFDGVSFLDDQELIDKRFWCAQTSQAWIDLQAIEVGDRFMSKWLYVDQLFESDSIANLNKLYCALITFLAENDWNTGVDFSIYLPAEDQKIIEAANSNEQEVSEGTLFGRFEEIALRPEYQDQIAAIDSGINQEFTYAQLLKDTQNLSQVILSLNAKGQLVGILSEKGYSQAVSTLSIMKAGKSYLPLNVDWPVGRLDEVLEQGQASLLLISKAQYSETHIREALSQKYQLLVIEDVLSEAQEKGAEARYPYPKVESDDVAYVIFTSGSTGKPKGVTISHRGALNTIDAINRRFQVIEKDKVLALSELSFDLSVYDLFGILAVGGCIVFPDQRETKNPRHWIELIQKNRITIWNTVPQLAGLLVDEANDLRASLDPLRVYLMSGDWIPTSLPDKLKFQCPSSVVMSLGGATEGSIWSIWYEIKAVQSEWSSIPYGVAMPNQKMYVLNQDHEHCPVGVAGDIYIGGSGVALNYWRDEELTRSKFISHSKLGRLYKTGDLGKWRRDGNMEFLGRSDFQVKIRGHRIELGEIETALAGFEGVKQSVILVKEHAGAGSGKGAGESSSNSKYLVGYYVSDHKLDEEKILQFLHSRLPEYMVPSLLVHLEKLPLTTNGKLDRKALPDPEFKRANLYVAARNELESQLCQVWAEVLGVPESLVGIRDDFFRLGGDSIISIQLVSRLRQRLGLNISVKDIFSHKTIERLYDQVLKNSVQKSEVSQIKTEQGVLSGEVPLLPIQKWFFENRFERKNHWNQSFLIKASTLELEKLRQSIARLVEHHDGFRLRFAKKSDQYIQFYDSHARIEELKVLDIRTLGLKEGSPEFQEKLDQVLTEWQSHFDLERGPLYSVGYLHGYQDGSSRVYFALHHLLIDVVSWRVIAEDLRDLYHQKELGPKGSSYRQWVNAVENYGKTHSEEREYWQKVLADYEVQTSLGRLGDHSVLESARSTKSTESARDTGSARSNSHLEFNREQTQALLRESNRAYHTQVNDLLLTALGYALAEVTGKKTNHIVLEGHGREEIDPQMDVSRSVGWFTTMYPVRLEVGEDLGSSIKSIKENLRQIPEKGMGYGAVFGYGEKALPQICFNYLGQLDQEDSHKSLWNITNESSGIFFHPENHSHALINIVCIVVDGLFQLNLSCSLGQEVADRITTSFYLSLNALISHTTSLNRSYLTRSDVDFIVSEKWIDRLQEDQEIEAIYLANSLQEGFISHSLNQAEKDEAYRVQAVWRYRTPIEVHLLKRAWEYAQAKFSSLRLRLAWEEELVQVIDQEGKLNWTWMDLSHEKSLEDQERKIAQIQEEDRLKPYSLENGGLFRIYLFKQKDDLYTCLFNTHHAIVDGWSSSILLGYVHQTYIKLTDKEVKAVIDSSVDRSYENTQKYLQDHKGDHLEFWQKYIAQLEGRADLSGLFSEKNKQIKLGEYKYLLNQKQKSLRIEGDLLEKLKALGQTEGFTLNAILQYVWHRVLRTYGNTEQTVVGTIVSGRNLPIDGIENSVGLFINTLPLIVNHQSDKDKRIVDCIREVQDSINEINNRSGIHLALLQKRGERLFDCLFMYENYPQLGDEAYQHKLKVENLGSIEKRDYPLAVVVEEKKNNLTFKIDYADELFSEGRIEEVLSTIEYVLEQIVANQSKNIRDLQYVNVAQFEQIVEKWNQTESKYSEDKVIHQIFEEQVRLNPDQLALVCGQNKMTYQDLNDRANQLASYLIKTKFAQPDTPIAICLDRSEFILIGILAVLKSGGAYVPIDPSYPDDRLARILKDSRASVVLTQEVYQERLQTLLSIGNEVNREHPAAVFSEEGTSIFALDSQIACAQISIEPRDNLNKPLSSRNLAYVIYTSGTTGQPKGVMIEHRSFIATIESIKDKYFFDKKKVSTYSVTNFVFDIFGLEYGLPLLTGGTLTLGNSLFEELNCSNFDFIQMTPSLCDLKLESLTRTGSTKLLVGGENLTSRLLTRSLQKFDEVVNVYGPTETTIWSTSRLYNRGIDNDLFSVSIGKPLHNEKAYVLDSNLQVLPIGAIGELYIGGVGLSRGYLNNPKLTAERFISNPVQTQEEKRSDQNKILYKTGDLVRWLPDGSLEFLGRNDFQVKMRGHRIELGEIESALTSYEKVKQGVVLVKNHAGENESSTDHQFLVGYYVSENKLDENQLIRFLQSKLSDYMVPGILVHLKDLPLTVNGKLDRKALPNPEFKRSQEYIAPRDEYEKLISSIWTKVLGQEKISVQDNFFDLGGNSILLIKMYSLLPAEIKAQVSMMDLFKYSSVSELKRFILQKLARNHQTEAQDGSLEKKEAQGSSISRKSRSTSIGDIAVIGMAGKFPGAENIHEYWDNLKGARESIRFYTREELESEGVSQSLLDNPNYVRAQSSLSDLKSFDAEFFGYTPREAEIMDPQHRMFMECVWQALEDANYDPYDFEGDIGLYAGAGQNKYVTEHIVPSQGELDLSSQYQIMINNQANFLCTKVAYKLNLTGPAMTIQTACSTSLVAVHQACLALRAGDCDMALAGGVSLGQLEKEGYLYQPGLIFSPDGKCRAFDSQAQGTFEGQGVGVVVLKPLDQAIVDQDHVYAVIKSSAINNDGYHKIGYTAPSPEKQAEVIRLAHEKAGITADTITYIEAHGTGTALGDPIEIEGLTQAFRHSTDQKQFCAIGSVKTNIGHLDVAAGIAGFIKAVLCLHHKTLVPSLHYNEPNPKIKFNESPFYVSTQLKKWESHFHPRRAGVSSFGIGGTNAHILLEEAPMNEVDHREKKYDFKNEVKPWHLISLSANSALALNRQAVNLSHHLRKNPQISLERLAYTLHLGRHRLKLNRFVVANDLDDVITALEDPGLFSIEQAEPKPTVFLFPGQGSQYVNMGRQLYDTEPVFKEEVDRCLQVLPADLVADLKDQMGNYITHDDFLGRTENVHQTFITQTALFIIEYSLAKYLIRMGIQPTVMMGHSIGEYVAACLSGVFTLEEGLKLTLERGRLLQSLPQGQMLAVNLPLEKLSPYLAGSQLDIAAINDVGSCVVSGPISEINPLMERLREDGVSFKLLNVSRAFHSRMLDPVLTEFSEILSHVKFARPRIPFISNLSGKWISPEEVVQPQYWVNHLRSTVLFEEGLSCLFKTESLKNSIVIEVGPSQVLTSLAKRHDARGTQLVLPMMKRVSDQQNDRVSLLTVLGNLWALGAEIDWAQFYGAEDKKRVQLPHYSFEKKQYWIPSSRSTVSQTNRDEANLLSSGSSLKRSLRSTGISLSQIASDLKGKDQEQGTLPQAENVTDQTEIIVAGIFRKILGVHDFTSKDDFFALGGDSLTALQLTHQLKSKLGFQSQLMSLKKVSVHEIVQALKNERAKIRENLVRSSPHLVTIQEGRSGKLLPLVMIHPIGGDIYFYRDLASGLDEEQTLYAIRSPMLDGDKTFASIEEIASEYLVLLEESGIKPPFVLGGSSFGGIVAYEMAQMIQASGYESPTVVLIDSPAHGNLPKPMSDQDILEYLVKYGLNHINISLEQLRSKSNVEQMIQYISEEAKATEMGEMLSAEFMPRFIETWQKHSVAMRNYVPKPYLGSVLFFSHSESIEEFPADQQLHWIRLAKGSFQNVYVPGNHISMNSKPNVEVISQNLQEFIDRESEKMYRNLNLKNRLIFQPSIKKVQQKVESLSPGVIDYAN